LTPKKKTKKKQTPPPPKPPTGEEGKKNQRAPFNFWSRGLKKHPLKGRGQGVFDRRLNTGGGRGVTGVGKETG